MSHFSVLVIGDNVEEQLAPYHEFECTGEDDQYVVDVDVTNDYMNDFMKYADQEKELDIPTWISEWSDTKIVAYGQDIDESGDHKYGYIQLKEDGSLDKVIRRTNPNAKWDYWIEGGRWSKWATAIDGGHIVSGPKSLFDFKAMYDEAYEKARSKYMAALLAVGDAEFKPFSYYADTLNMDINLARTVYWGQEAIKRLKATGDERFQWEIDQDIFKMSEHEYAGKVAAQSIRTYAVVKDGNWYAKGEMGWFGCSRDEKADWPNTYKQLLDSAGDDELLTVVDCHI